MPEFRIAVLISGGGTTLRNLIEVCSRNDGELKVDLALVISSNPQAKGLQYAREAGIPFEIVDYRQYRTPDSISAKIFELCRQHKISLVVLGGFLRRLAIPRNFRNRVINIHPSLIPAYCGKGLYGIRVHRAVIENGAKVTGCTVHFVDDQYDHGPIIAQQSVRVFPDDTPETLAERVFERECELYPRIINAIAMGRVDVIGDEVIVHRGD